MNVYPRTRTQAKGKVTHDPFPVFRRAFKDNLASTSITMAVPTETRPSTSTVGVHELYKGTNLLIIPYGVTDASAVTCRGAVQLWYPIYDSNKSIKESESVVWIGVLALCTDFRIVGGVSPASKAGPIETTDEFCDFVIEGSGTSYPDTSFTDFSETANVDSDEAEKVVAWSKIPTNGAKYVQFYADYNGFDFRVTDSTPINYLFTEV
jgi:hypothetical protein